MSLQTPNKLVELQTALHAKAKAAPTYRFYVLYDKLYRWDVLSFAYERCRANQGAAGVDGQTFQDIKAYGERRWVKELAKELQEKTVNEKKTRRATLPEDEFTFLGYTFCRQYSRRTGAAYLGTRPAIKKIRARCAAQSAS